MPNYNLVFEGGGAKGFAYSGALKALQETNPTYNTVIGTSAGSIVAFFLSIGCSADEIEKYMYEKDSKGKSIFFKFLDYPSLKNFTFERFRNSSLIYILDWLLPVKLLKLFRLYFMVLLIYYILFMILKIFQVIRTFFSIIEYGGIFQGEAVKDWLGDKLEQQGFPRNITMLNLYKITGVNLNIIASDTDGPEKEQLILNHINSPDLPVVVAVRMSMSIPLVYIPVTWNKYWGTYRGRVKYEHEIVDGGLLSNFAIDLLFENKRMSVATRRLSNTYTIGFLLDNKVTPDEFIINNSSIIYEVLSRSKLLTRSIKWLDTALSNDNKNIYRYKKFIVKVPCGGIGTLEFNMDEKKKTILNQYSYKITKKYLNDLFSTKPSK